MSLTGVRQIKGLLILTLALTLGFTTQASPKVCRALFTGKPASKILNDSQFARIRSSALKSALANIGFFEHADVGELWNKIEGKPGDVKDGNFDLDMESTLRVHKWMTSKNEAYIRFARALRLS
jgi:hypothetical protein